MSTTIHRRAPTHRNKYGVRLDDAGKAARTYDGRTYASKLEARFAAHLDILRHAEGTDRVLTWRPQIRVPLAVNGTKVCDYVVDFEVIYADGRTEYVEVKGRWLPVARLKYNLFRALYPDRTIRIVQNV